MTNTTVFLAGQTHREVGQRQTRTRLGRHPANDIGLDVLFIGGEHAVIPRLDGQLPLEDRHSTHGRIDNRQRMQQLEPGKLIATAGAQMPFHQP